MSQGLVQNDNSHSSLIALAQPLIEIHRGLIFKQELEPIHLLKDRIKRELNTFEAQCRFNSIDPMSIRCAQYVLCSWLDETVMNADWHQDVALWPQQTLLSELFNEMTGGETFFRIRLFCLEHLPQMLGVFSLVYVCLCFGFKGKYALEANGELTLLKLKQESWYWLNQYQKVTPAPVVDDSKADKRPVNSFKGLFKVTAGACGVFVLLVYLSASVVLHQESSAAVAAVSKMEVIQ